MAKNTITNFQTFIYNNCNAPLLSNEDIVHLMLPLLKQIQQIHEKELVVPIYNYQQLQWTQGYLHWPNLYGISRKIQPHAIKSWNHYFKQTFQIEQISLGHLDIEENTIDEQQTTSIEINAKNNTPQYVPNYNSYELIAGHHDQLTDIFCIGQIMASIIFQLDLNDQDDWYEFKKYIGAPIYANEQLHPTISKLITQMTTLNRTERIGSINEVIQILENYQAHQPVASDLLDEANLNFSSTNKNLSQQIIAGLKSKLFDTSKRNRLLYYKQSAKSVNLSIGSIPNVLHYEHIRVDELCIWNEKLLQLFQKNKPIQLNQWLHFTDHPYLPVQLDKLRLEDQKNQQEFGFSQLNFVPIFLNWFHYKEDPTTAIQTPLLLIPVQIKKTKALVVDQYALHLEDAEAIVNPILAQVLWDNYQLKLPVSVPLKDAAFNTFFEYLKQIIQQSNSGVQLQLINKPRLDIMHTIAVKNRQQYQKTNKKSNAYSSNKPALNFPIQKASGQLLGIQLFEQYLKQHTFELSNTVSNIEEKQKSTSYYQISKPNDNPYIWEIDTCNIVVGNFNTQKMRLVADYDWMAEQKTAPAIIDTLFIQNKIIDPSFNNQEDILDDNFTVIDADPSQLKAIQAAKAGKSFVIQGPPGTGKSQTITNIIANGIADGKSILFVCEKRAALDVVYARLKQHQLHNWCSYIHNSQTDKKAFIQDLKNHYEHQLKQPLNWDLINRERATLLVHVKNALHQLQVFHNTLQTTPNATNYKIYQFIDILLGSKVLQDEFLHQEYFNILPDHKEWEQFEDVLFQFQTALDKIHPDTNFASHPFSQLNNIATQKAAYKHQFEQLLQSTYDNLQQLSVALQEYDVPYKISNDINSLQKFSKAAQSLAVFAKHGQLDLLKPTSSQYQQFKQSITQLQQTEAAWLQQKEKNKNWIDKWDEQQASQALQICKQYENKFFKFLYPNWRRTKKLLQTSYNINGHAIKPMWTDVLLNLLKEYELVSQIKLQTNNIHQTYALDALQLSTDNVEIMHSNLDVTMQFLIDQASCSELITVLDQQYIAIESIQIQLRQLLENYDKDDLQGITDRIENIIINLPQLQWLQSFLQALASMPLSVQHAIKNIPYNIPTIQAAVLQKTYNKIKTASPHVTQFNWLLLQQTMSQIKHGLRELLAMNKLYIHANSNKNLHDHLKISAASNSNLNEQQKAFKKIYQEGRKILEHEFNKSMRYKSIRILNETESNLVIKDLKPVWLMSPLSVADIFPIGLQAFDMIIFDEASQITIEDAIPAASRGPQIIIVGDEQQMPPTAFFKTQNQETESIENTSVVHALEVDSLLVQGNQKLPAVVLNWHYRSRFEPLINFCNHAFYQSDLLTFPDIKNHTSVSKLPIIQNSEQGSNMLGYMLDRSISYHYLPFGIYEQRRNVAEANYIAHLIKTHIMSGATHTLGVVAFSMEQQACIEESLERLAAEDSIFANALDNAYNRYDNEQFVGLIIKNLEQIQGDERDIMILSIGYATNADGKMKMHFGPINQKGGEKRLNVLFSRAKQHMVVVSSIFHDAISNTYNDGANYFKQFLQYAQHISEGNIAAAYEVLKHLNTKSQIETKLYLTSNTITQIIDFIKIKGYYIDRNIGAASLKCPIAVKRQHDDQQYILGIFIDDDYHYQSGQAKDAYYYKQSVLQSFGWNTLLIPSKMWLEEKESIQALILATIEGNKSDQKQLEKKEVIEIDKYVDLNNTKEFATNKLNKQSILKELLWERYEKTTANGNIVFWEISTAPDHKMITRFGNIGTQGITKSQRYKSEQEVAIAYAAAIQEKIADNYIKK